MSGVIRGQVDIGFSGAVHDFEVEAPDNWGDLSAEERDNKIEEIVMQEFYNVSNSWGEYVQKGQPS